jgi:hypothetical protein
LSDELFLAIVVFLFAGGVVGTLLGFTFYYNEKRMVVYWKGRYEVAYKDYLQAMDARIRDTSKIYDRWRDSLRTKPSHPEAPPVPSELLGKMIRLCHPDKHRGSASATEVTQWLLEQRK